MSHITLLGAGLLGRLIALKLSKNHQIDMYDKGDETGQEAAAFVAAAMLAPTAEAVDATPLVTRLGYKSVALWQDILKEIPTAVFMQLSGSLIVWHQQDEDLATQFLQDLTLAHKTKDKWQHWTSDDIKQQEPQLSRRFQQGFYLPSEGQLDNRQVLFGLAKALEDQDVTTHWGTESTLEAMCSDDWTIDCRGFGAKADWNQSERTHTSESDQYSKLRGIRGEVARVYAPEITLNRPVRLLHPRYPLYIAPKEDHVFVIGATQIESEDDSALSVRSGLELFSSLYALHPAFGEARVLECLTQLRPTLSHHNPEIKIDLNRKFIQINGLFRHGFMISPAVTQSVVTLINALIQGKIPQEDTENGVLLTYI